MNFRLPIDNSLRGQMFTLPGVRLTYLQASPNSITIDFNGTPVLLSTDDIITSRTHMVNNRYMIQVNRAFPDALIFTIEDTLQIHQLNIPFNVDLEENRSTGFTWEAITSPGLNIIQDVYLDNCPEGIVGCPGTRHYVLMGTTVGDHNFMATYHRGDEVGQVKNILVRIT